MRTTVKRPNRTGHSLHSAFIHYQASQHQRDSACCENIRKRYPQARSYAAAAICRPPTFISRVASAAARVQAVCFIFIGVRASALHPKRASAGEHHLPCARHTQNTRFAVLEIIPPVDDQTVARWWRRLSRCGSEGVDSLLRLQRDAASVGVQGLRNSRHSRTTDTMACV